MIDHAIIPMRDLFSAAESRRAVSERSRSEGPTDPGGLWHTQTPTEQENVLTHKLYKVIYALAKHDVPATFLYFPRFVQDAEYLYRKIGRFFPSVTARQFLHAHNAVCRPELVHQFRRKSA